MTTLICIPTYNEIANLRDTVAAVRAAAPEVEILIIDDASLDGTGDLADLLAAADPTVHVLHRTGKDGLGRAYLAGFAWAMEHGSSAVVEMDADGSHRAVDLPRILAALDDGADVVLGSRWMPGGRVQDWAWQQLLLSRAGNVYPRVMLRLPYHDITGGYRAFRVQALRRLRLEQVTSEGYCFQIDLARRAHRSGLAIVEVPITFLERVHGVSKMSRRIVLEALWNVTLWSLRPTIDGATRDRRPDAAGATRASA